ncbi:MAG: zinc ABC transporter substrate-binding protein [Pelagimonas sp.]|uniref:zinc ABC transporter substrate-binding protein n=1 Tax=Pelagimonas sp. TaxID=2073170 RepID=UPI003D6C143B
MTTSIAMAEVPRVVTDILPVQSLVAMVMDTVAEPDLLLAPGASPHDLALRPSQAKMLSKADVVIWIGPELTPSLSDHLETLSPNAMQMVLMEAQGAHLLPYRDEAVFGGHSEHDDEDNHDEDHAEDGHEDNHKDGHEDGHGDAHHDEDGHDDAHDHAHGDGENDPHLWLDPDNAILWLEHIAQALGQLDEENSDTYFYNATNAIESIKAAQASAQEILAPVKSVPMAAYHDAYQYYETAFDLNLIGAISDSDAVQPGAKRLGTLRDSFEQQQPKCFLMEPGANARLILSVGWAGLLGNDSGKEPIARLDPLGAHLETGPKLYPTMLTDLATRIADCVSE